MIDFFNNLSHNFMYYIIAVIGVTAFFAHESFSFESEQGAQAKTEWLAIKEQRTASLETVKSLAIGTMEYNDYWAKKQKTDEAYNKYLNVLDSERFLGFKNFQQFVGEFGWALGLFIYALFNLILIFIEKPINTFIGKAVMHTTFITIAIFYLRWCFNRVDYLNSKYVLYNILTVVMILTSAYLFVKHKEQAYNKLQKAFNAVSRFAFIGIKKHIHPEKMEEYKKDSIKALKDGL